MIILPETSAAELILQPVLSSYHWTGAAVACFASNLVRRRLNEIAPPGQLNRYMLSVMRIVDANSFVEFVFKEAVPEGVQGASDTSCSVEVWCNGFAGRVNSVWFARSDIDRFLSDLQDFERVRNGFVSLDNMSSLSDDSPLDFEISSVGSLGHLAVRTTLRRITHAEELNPLTVSISFALDPGALRQALDDFRELFAFPLGRI